MKIPSQLDFFYPGKGVSDTLMQNFVLDLYTKFQGITKKAAPCILYGSEISQKDNIFSISEGAFRFQDATINDQIIPVFGIATDTSIELPDNFTGFLMVKYTVSSETLGLPVYFTPVEYFFKNSAPGKTEVAVAYFVGGILQKTSLAIKYYINSEAEPIEAKNGISNSSALTPKALSLSFSQQSKDLILQKTGYYTLPGYASGLYADPKANPCPKRMHIYGQFDNLKTTSKIGQATVIFDSSIPALQSTILHALPQGMCQVTPTDGKPAYQCGVFTMVSLYNKNGFNLLATQPYNGDATYTYHGTYTALAYSPL